MSYIETYIPDSRWYSGGWYHVPKDKQLCIVIPRTGEKTKSGTDNYVPIICQYRHENPFKAYAGYDNYFLNIGDLLKVKDSDIKFEIFYIEKIHMWQPITLPDATQKIINNNIETAFNTYVKHGKKIFKDFSETLEKEAEKFAKNDIH